MNVRQSPIETHRGRRHVFLNWEIGANTSRLSAAYSMNRPLKQHVTELEKRIRQLSLEIMRNRKTQEERNRVEAELRVAQQALDHYQQAIQLENRLAGR